MKKLQDLRGTGRTTRMLADARRLASEGKAVYVICANEHQQKLLEQLAGEEGRRLGVKFETPTSAGNFDWETMRLRGGHPNCEVLIDHYAIECRFARILELLHRYDLKEE